MQAILLYLGAGVIFIWGLGHLIPTRTIVGGFGSLSLDNQRIITMEWLAEGLTLCFVGVLVALMVLFVGPAQAATHLVACASSLMLFVMAGVSAFTGARTSVLPMKLCPVIKTGTALLFLAGTFL
jgi:hypothetical protein